MTPILRERGSKPRLRFGASTLLEEVDGAAELPLGGLLRPGQAIPALDFFRLVREHARRRQIERVQRRSRQAGLGGRLGSRRGRLGSRRRRLDDRRRWRLGPSSGRPPAPCGFREAAAGGGATGAAATGGGAGSGFADEGRVLTGTGAAGCGWVGFHLTGPHARFLAAFNASGVTRSGRGHMIS